MPKKKAGRKTGPPKGSKRGTLAFKRALQRRRFVRQYVAGARGIAGQAGPAALAAGLATTENSARVRGTLMLRDPEVVAAVERQLEAIGAETSRIVEELGRIAFADGRDLERVRRLIASGEDLDEVEDHVAAVIKDVSVSFGKTNRTAVSAHDKVAALGLLAKVRGLLIKRVELTGPDGGPVRHEHAVRVYLPHNGRAALPPGQVIEAEAIRNGGGAPGAGRGGEDNGRNVVPGRNEPPPPTPKEEET